MVDDTASKAPLGNAGGGGVGSTYMLNLDNHLQSSVDKVDSQEFLDSLTKELVDLKKQEIIDNLKYKIKKENEQKYKEELQSSINSEFKDQFKSDLKNSINYDFTKKYFDEQEKSYKLLNDLKAEYLEKHKSSLRDFALLDTFKTFVDNTPGLSENFDMKKELNKHLDKYLDKKDYFKYILEDLLMANRPKTKELSSDERGSDIQGKFYKYTTNPILSKNRLSECVKLNEKTFDDLQSSHDTLVKLLKSLDEPPSHIAHGSGIIISGGGVYFGGALVTIGQIREMGSTLPIEVIINTRDEYDVQICEDLLPNQFNAKCVIIEEEIGKETVKKLNLKKFQMKVLGFLASSFDNIIALDADNLPLKNVDELLDSEPFLTTKFVLWPDIWHKQTSPVYYDIARIKVGEPIHREGIANDWSYKDYIEKDKFKDVMFHDLENTLPGMSVETGQMVFSKKTHYKSFLLSLYYNIYGPSHYYRIFFQGTPGEGDRETFLPALHVFQEPYHLAKHNAWLAGYKEKDGFFQETAIVQYDPKQSTKFFNDWQNWLIGKKLDSRLWPFQDNSYTKDLLSEFKKNKAKVIITEDKDDKVKTVPYKLPDVMFLHTHKPKINPIVNSAKDGYGGVYTRRNLGKPEAYADDFGKTDWELKFHTISRWVACVGIKSETYWKNIAQLERNDVCSKVTKYVEFLQKDSKDLKAGDLKFLKF